MHPDITVSAVRAREMAAMLLFVLSKVSRELAVPFDCSNRRVSAKTAMSPWF